jgi:Raf kinase inhibitor-like YbhB/YbcL family protein
MTFHPCSERHDFMKKRLLLLLSLGIFFMGISVVIVLLLRPVRGEVFTGVTITLPGGSGIVLASPAFSNGGSIPVKYTCDGEDVSPPLEWGKSPTGTQSFVLIMEDPDAPVGTWVHWIVYYLPTDARFIPENFRNGTRFDDVAALFGKNSWGKTAYGGPCPPSGTHRYTFILYALDSVPAFPEESTRKQVLAAIEGHVLGSGELMGTYGK